jgi:hypothetical protein
MHIVKEIAGLLTFKMLMIRFSTERMIRGLSLSLSDPWSTLICHSLLYGSYKRSSNLTKKSHAEHQNLVIHCVVEHGHGGGGGDELGDRRPVVSGQGGGSRWPGNGSGRWIET